MKKIIKTLVFIVVLLATFTLTSFEEKPMHSIEGTWELESFYNYENQKITDTIFATDGYRQIKMYYNGKIMWTRYVPKDKIGRFGYGSYSLNKDTLIETIEYGDNEMIAALDTLRKFSFELKLTDDSFSQISVDEEGNRTFSENYKRID